MSLPITRIAPISSPPRTLATTSQSTGFDGPQTYFGDYTYLDASQRKAIAAWAERLKELQVKFIQEGIADGSVVQWEPEFVVQWLLGMLIWLAKSAPAVDGMTGDRLMNAIDAFSFSVVLPYFTFDGTTFVVGFNGGAAEDPDWVRNLRKTPTARVYMQRR